MHMETFSAAPTPRPVVLRAFTLLCAHSALHSAILQQRLNYHRALSSVILAATAPFFRPLRDFPPNNRVGRDTRQNRALVAIIQTLGVQLCIMIHLCVKKSGAVYSVLEVISSSLQGNVALSILALPLWVYRHASLYIGKWVKKSTPKSFSFKEQPIATRGYQHNSTRSLA